MIKDYSPTSPYVYGYVLPIDTNIDKNNINETIVYLLEEFVGHTKNIICKEEAINYWFHCLGIQKIKCTEKDIVEAYNLAYGYGCEFEWHC